MTTFARSLSTADGNRGGAARRAALAVLLTALAWLLAAAPAGAVIAEVPSGPTIGLQPRNGTTFRSGAPSGEFQNAGGNAVVHSPETYVIYWDPKDGYFEAWQRIIDQFFQGVGNASGSLATNFAVIAQYGDKTNAPPKYNIAFRGAYTDTNKYPAVAGCKNPGLPALGAVTCLTDAQIREQLQTFIGQHNLSKGMRTIFFLITPPGVTVCADAAATHCSDYEGTLAEEKESYKNSFCSYHAAVNSGGLPTGDNNTILYAVLPWIASGFATESYDCQDGGFNPTKGEAREKAKEQTAKEIEEFESKTLEEKEKAEAKRLREGPHVQEPNQPATNSEDFLSVGGLADLIINQAAIELQNTATDPLLNAWHDKEGNEATDLCRNTFDSSGTSAGGGIGGASALQGSVEAIEETGAGTLSNQNYGGNYYINNVFNLSARLRGHGPLCPAGVALDPHFTAPTPVNTGETVGFDGMESEIWLDVGTVFSPEGVASKTYSTYTWNFGDGTPTVSGYAPGAPVCEAPWLSPCAASVFHSYQYGGTYNVSLRVRDVGGNEAEYTRPVTVIGPPPPSPAGGGSGSAAGGSGSAGAAGAGSGAPVTTPVAGAAVLSRTLRGVQKSGVVVRYSVNEQVAGRFEVLMNAALAHRLGIGGPAAVGLPAGTPPELVIGKAILVTTKGGRSTVDIQFSHRTAQRLARLRRVSLMLRLIVRNSAAHGLQTTTVLSTFTLTH